MFWPDILKPIRVPYSVFLIYIKLKVEVKVREQDFELCDLIIDPKNCIMNLPLPDDVILLMVKEI